MKKSLAVVAGLLCTLGLGVVDATAKSSDGKWKIYLSMSYVGNDWQTESGNIVKAMASSKDLKDKLDFEVQVAGTDAQKQIQQINAMVQSGADAIIMFPISPTALNATIKNACAKGVKVFTYIAEVTEPCAYNLVINEIDAGAIPAEWMAKQINYKGNIVMVTGVPGTSVDTKRNEGAEKVFKKYPDIKIIARVVGMWSQATARSELTKLTATVPWDQINGVWTQTGCYAAGALQDEAGIPDDKKVPCSGEASNGDRVQMLKTAEGIEGATDSYRPMGYPGLTYAAPLFYGAMQLKRAVEFLEGGKEPAHMDVQPLPYFVSDREKDQLKLCKEGTWKEMNEGCNVFQPSLISNPAWFSGLFSPDLPQIGVQAALNAKPEY
ncbi:ABC transporter substrate-binding protein [Agrobacterium sp. MOPV5]|uniref:sugar ABC transporter substrate-binding protein n=1 Tax=Agrobacterium leguminum TaxID=2792015 RepID=UPI0018C20038|nr:sugar ABC transporter substrate-binding protein [Agrobacterium leguminum]MBG0511014.1 ABC transporter substrate-binding protein [Agrobacterium leguminum]